MRITSALVVLAALIAGCDGLGSSPDAPVTVVESYYIAGESLAEIRLSRTASVNDSYDVSALAIADAVVNVERVAPDGTVDATYPYAFDDGRGTYRPTDLLVNVVPSATYRLVAQLSDGTVVSASTTVPGTFEVRRVSPTSARYQSSDQIEVDVTRSNAGDRQSIFVFSIESLDPRLDGLTPLYADFIGEDGDLSDVLITESPPINEQNYDLNDDGTLTIRLPWIAVAFYGPNRIIASTLDDNLYDFLRSQQVQQGGSTFSPGEIPNVIAHVDGGTGVFGSLARVATVIQVDR